MGKPKNSADSQGFQPTSSNPIPVLYTELMLDRQEMLVSCHELAMSLHGSEYDRIIDSIETRIKLLRMQRFIHLSHRMDTLVGEYEHWNRKLGKKDKNTSEEERLECRERLSNTSQELDQAQSSLLEEYLLIQEEKCKASHATIDHQIVCCAQSTSSGVEVENSNLNRNSGC